MATNVVMRTRIRMNGKEYTSVQDLPPALRDLYERALADLGGDAPAAHTSAGAAAAPGAPSHASIVFNGREYDNVEAMPSDVRRLYQDALALLESPGSESAPTTTAGAAPTRLWDRGGSGLSAAISTNAGTVNPQSTARRLVIVGLVGALLLLLLWRFGGGNVPTPHAPHYAVDLPAGASDR